MNKVPYSFIRGFLSPTWSELAYGIEQGLLELSTAVDHACECMAQGIDDGVIVRLASCDAHDHEEIKKCVSQLVTEATVQDSRDVKCTWLFILLAWVYQNRNSYDCPLEIVEKLYAEYGYPEDVAPFVRYMPPQNGYRPLFHTEAENTARLMSLWGNYIERKRESYRLRAASEHR